MKRGRGGREKGGPSMCRGSSLLPFIVSRLPTFIASSLDTMKGSPNIVQPFKKVERFKKVEPLKNMKPRKKVDPSKRWNPSKRWTPSKR